MSTVSAGYMDCMTDINTAAAAARENARTHGGQFGAQEHSAPDVALTAGPLCTEGCGSPAEYRLANIPQGYRSPESESFYCPVHAALEASEGTAIEGIPQPQEDGEEIIWLIEGDDHEVKLVEAVTEEEAIDKAAELFEEQYDDEGDEDDEDEEREPVDVRDLLSVAGTFRGDIDGYSDELDFVPWGDLSENDAYNKLQNA